MKLFGLFILFASILVVSWEIQKTDLLLGYTLGVFGILISTILIIDNLAKKYL
jgi:hypothetical protein